MDCGVWHRECLLIKGNFPLEALDFNCGPEIRAGCGKILTGALLRRLVCLRIWGLWKWDLHRHLPESQRTTVSARDPAGHCWGHCAHSHGSRALPRGTAGCSVFLVAFPIPPLPIIRAGLMQWGL